MGPGGTIGGMLVVTTDTATGLASVATSSVRGEMGVPAGGLLPAIRTNVPLAQLCFIFGYS